MKKISVIIPVYKVEEFLGKCVDSLINQKYKNLEIILVDDGSPDNCPKICDEYAKKDSRIIVVHKKNAGVSEARNTGISVATGQYLTFVDSDDFVDNNFSLVCDEINNLEADIVIVPLNSVGNDEEISLNYKKYSELIRRDDICISSTWSKFYKKNIVDDERFLKDVKIAEDKEFVCRILTKCNKIKILNKPFYQYLIREGSAMNTNCSIFIERLVLSTEKIFEKISTYNYSQYYKNELRELFSSNLYGAFRFFPDCNRKEKKKIKKLFIDKRYLFEFTNDKRKRSILKLIKFFGFGFVMWILYLLRKCKFID